MHGGSGETVLTDPPEPPAPRPGRYRILEDVALSDWAVEIEGDDLADVFETAARALAALMVDPATVPTTVGHTIELTAPALDLLLYDWLSEVIFRKDRDREIFTRTRVQVAGEGPYRLAAAVEGGVIDPIRTALGADAKAVTFHQLRVEQVGRGWRARVVVDV